MTNDPSNKKEEQKIEPARFGSAEPQVRNIIMREHNEARPRNPALVKRGPQIHEQILRDMERALRNSFREQPGMPLVPDKRLNMDGPDMDLD